MGGVNNILHNTNTEYNALVGGISWTNTIGFHQAVCPTDGLIKNLRVKLDGAPGGGTHYDFTLMVNGAPTALTLEIAGAAVTGSDMVNEINVAPGDTMCLQCDPDNTPTARYAAWTCVFEGDTTAESIILASTNNTLSNAAIRYGQAMFGTNTWTATEDDCRQVIPTDGTLKKFYVRLSADPGTAPDAYRFTVRIDGVSPGGGLVVTITANDTTGFDVANTIDVSAGDVITVMVEPLNGPSVAPYVGWGMVFLADIDGESIILGGTYDNLPNTDTEYNAVTGTKDSPWHFTEANFVHLGQACWVGKLRILLTAAPGAGNKYDFNIRAAVGATNVIATVSGAATTGDSGTLYDTIANDEYVDLEVNPDDTPDAADAYWGFVVSDRAFRWTGKISGVTNPAKIMGVAVEDISEVKGVARPV